MKQKIFGAWRHVQRFSLSWSGQITTLLLLLGKILWGVWEWRDLTYGDTSSYFSQIAGRAFGAHVNLVFSPLYVGFYGFFIHAFENAVVATLLHRIVLLVLLAWSLLLLARALLPRAIAWLVAAWWVVLPVDWNALYEVHLFGFLPLVLGCWMLAGRARRFSLSVGLALVWSTALLVRNEYALSVALLALCCALREWRLWKMAGGSFAQMTLKTASLALPSLLVLAVAGLALRHDWPGWEALQKEFMGRTTVNMAQVYPFSYQQRHPEWHDDPWLHGYKLVKKHFGAPLITFSDALFRNPKAMIEHMRWHVRLVPAGLQLAMFNGHFGPYSPDFTAPRQLPWRAGVLSSLVLLLMAAGVWCIRQRKAFFRRFFRSRRGWAWLGLLCLLPPCAVAILTQRPRPSYIFPLSFFLMAVTGLCLYAVLHRLKLWRSFQKAFPLFVLAVLGSAYSAKSTAQIYVGQPLKEAYDRIFPFREHLQGPRSVLVSRQFNAELNSYINLKSPDKHHYQPLVTSWLSTAIGFQQALDKKKVSLLYLDTADFAHPIAREWLSGEGAKHWTLLAGDLQAERPWAFLERKVELAPKPAEPGPGSPVPPDAH